MNKIELKGVVGNVRLQDFPDRTLARLTLATNYAYKDKDGTAVIETAWHNIVAREGRSIHDLSKIEKGARLHVVGRMRYQKYVGSDGTERVSAEVVANKLEAIDDPAEPLGYEM